MILYVKVHVDFLLKERERERVLKFSHFFFAVIKIFTMIINNLHIY